MRRAAKVDANQAEIVEALRAVGCSVQDLSSVGQGVTDLLIGCSGVNLLIEVKTTEGTYTPAQIKWHAAWRGQRSTVRSIDEALALVEAIRSQTRILRT